MQGRCDATRRKVWKSAGDSWYCGITRKLQNEIPNFLVRKSYLPYACPYNLRLVYFKPTFWRLKNENSYSRSFFLKILALGTVSIQVRFIIKRELWWRVWLILWQHYFIWKFASNNQKYLNIFSKSDKYEEGIHWSIFLHIGLSLSLGVGVHPECLEGFLKDTLVLIKILVFLSVKFHWQWLNIFEQCSNIF